MGNWSSNFVEVPDTEYTPCAVMLKKMGYRVVVFGFEDVVVAETPSVATAMIDNHWVIPTYDESAQLKLARQLADNMSESVSTMIVSLLSKGLVVVVITKHTSHHNGQATHDEAALAACAAGDASCGHSGYIYQGVPLIESMFHEHLGYEVSKFIRVEEGKKTWTMIKELGREYRMAPSEVLVVHENPEIVRKARHYHMGGILVGDHKLGLQLS